MKVEVFSAYSEKLLSKAINEFIENNSHNHVVKDIKFNSITFKSHEGIIVKEFSALVMLERFTKSHMDVLLEELER